MAGELEPDGKTPKSTRKAPTAYRTISEVSDDLGVPQHVLRFWETKFSQIRPLKRGGGRRYYRPEDIQILRRIQGLLYEEGYTIKGVQRLLRAPKEGRSAARTEGAAPAGTGARAAAAGDGPADAAAESPPDVPPELPLGLPSRTARTAPTPPVPPPMPEHAVPPEVSRELSLLLMELKSLKSLLTGAPH